MYKAAVIGCGGRAPAHIEAYALIDNAEVVACCAPSAVRREPLASKYGLRAYGDVEKMLLAEKPDIVHIITGLDVRVELMSLVSALKVPLCTVEKPIAIGSRDWRSLMAIEAGTSTRFATCHQFRWQPHVMQCQQVIKSGNLGRIKFIDISSGMNIIGQGTHTLNYGMSLNSDSPVRQVFANAAGWDRNDKSHPAPLTTEASLTFENGVRGLWTSGFVSPKCGAPETTWQHVRIAAYAEKGRVLFEEFANWEIVSSQETQTGNFGGMDNWRKNNNIAQANFHKAMFDWLEKDITPGASLTQSLHEWKVVLAVYQSALEHRVIDIEAFEPREDLIERLKAVLGSD